MELKSENKGFSIVLVLLLVVVLVAGVGVYVYFKSPSSITDRFESGEDRLVSVGDKDKDKGTNSSTTGSKTPAPTSKPKYVKPIASGKQTYLVSGKFEGPSISRVTIDPQDAKAGQMQKISVDVSDSNPVTRVYVVIKLDTASSTVELKLVSGTATAGTWEASSPFPEGSLDSNYTIMENAESATGKSMTTTTIR